jgi:uncharacterized protein YkwD
MPVPLAAALAVSALLAVPVPPAHAAQSCADDDRAEAIRCLINRERSERDLPLLRADERLADAAADHSRDMVRRRFFDHVSPGGSTPGRRVTRAGYGWTSLGETIAWGTGSKGSPAGTVERWMDSPPHRRILLEAKLRDIGIGVARGAPMRGASGGTTVTADLGRR